MQVQEASDLERDDIITKNSLASCGLSPFDAAISRDISKKKNLGFGLRRILLHSFQPGQDD